MGSAGKKLNSGDISSFLPGSRLVAHSSSIWLVFRFICLVGVFTLELFHPILSFAETSLTNQQQRGKQIYIQGKGQKPVVAYLSGPDIKMPAENFACIQCHKEDGRGGREGGVLAPDITYTQLITPVSGVRPTGRSFLSYNEESLATAIQQGADPAGNPLHSAMPRYTLQKEDLNDLIAYLKVLGSEAAPGVTNDRVQVGTLIPSNGPLAEAGQVVVKLLSAYFEDMNEGGGLFGRKLELIPIEFDPQNTDSALASIKSRLKENPVFCMIGNLGLPPEGEIAHWINSQRIPVIAPLAITPDQPYILGDNTFYLYSSFTQQAQVLMDFLVESIQLPDPTIAILHADDKNSKDGARGVRSQNKNYNLKIGWDRSFPLRVFSAVKTVQSMKNENPDAVFYFGPGKDAHAFILEADRQGWHPLFLGLVEQSGAFLLRDSLPEKFSGKIFLASPMGPQEKTSKGMTRLLRLMKKFKLSPRYFALQTSAYAGGMLLKEGLKTSGRNTTQSRLIQQVGQLWQFETGVTPELTYNDNRREGAVGATISRLDKVGDKLNIVPEVKWKEPREFDK
jgi:ABC-type branched-subunit amino acid transport system substrate-binding protein